MQYNQNNSEDYYLIKTGRQATTSGLIVMIIALIIALLNSWNTVGTIFFMLFGAYVGITGFWGGYNTNLWFRKHKYSMNDLIWKILKIPVIISGSFLGLLVWGLIEHLLLVIAMEDTVEKKSFTSLFIAALLLFPYLGPWLENKINYSTKPKK
ncbi:MAG: hypothetical protein ACQEQD_03880 [Bacillota bacterium]